MEIKKALNSNLFANFVSLGIIQGLNYILPLITIPFLYNQLGVENYGLVNFTFAFIQYFIILTDFGFGLSGTRFIADNKEKTGVVNRFLNSVCIARLYLCLLSFCILIICISFIPSLKSHKIFILLFFGQVFGNIMNPSWFFQGMEKMKYNTIIHVVTRTISILPLFFLVKQPEDYIYIPICYSLGSIFVGFCSFRLICKKFGMRIYYTSLAETWSVTKDSSRYFLSRMSTSLYTNTNTFILGLVCGSTAVGYFSLAEKIYNAFNQIYAPINTALFPYMTKWKNVLLFKKIIKTGTLLNALFLICFIFIFPYFCPLIFSEFSENSYRVLNILLLSNIVSVPASFLGYPFIAALGHPNFTNYSYVIASVFHLVGLSSLYILGILDITTVATLVAMCECLVLCIRIYGIKKYNLW